MADSSKPLLHQSIHEIVPKPKARSYWPTALRSPWLLAVTAFVLTLLAGLEVAARKLPTNARRHYPTFKDITEGLQQSDSSITSSDGLARRATAASYPRFSSPPPANNAGAGPSSYVDLLVTSSIAVMKYVPDTTEEAITFYSTANPELYVAPEVTITNTEIETETVVTVTYSEAYIAEAKTMTVSSTISSTSTTRTFDTTNRPAAPSGVYTFTQTFRTTMETLPASLDANMGSDRTFYTAGSTAYVVAAMVTTTTEDVVISASATVSADPSGYVPPSISVNQFNKQTSVSTIILRFPIWKILVGNYLPIFLAIALKLLWTPINANAKLMQPFIAMSASKGGVSARKALFSNYLAQSVNPLRPLLDASWLTLGTGVNMVLVTLIAPLSSEAIFLDTNYECTNPNPDPSVKNPCWPPRITADTYIVRILQGLLCVIALICVWVMWFAARSSILLPMDPSSIAGAALLIHHPAVLHDIRSEEPDASSADLKKSLQDRKYVLQQYLTADGRWKFGIVPAAITEYAPEDYDSFSKPPRRSRSSQSSRRCGNIWLCGLVIFLCLGFLGLIVAYYIDHSKDAFNEFFNSNGFGPRFIMTGTATIVDTFFKIMQQDVVLAAPFRHLKTKPRTASSSILLRKFSLPHFAIFSFLRHGYVFAAAFSTVAVLSDILVILAAIIPYSPGRFWIEFLVSSYVCIGTLSAMIIATMVYFFWIRGVRMPRKPDTLGGVMSYVCASRLLEDIDWFGDRTEEALRKNGIRYMYGKFEGTDGVVRWMIDSCR